MLPAEGRPLQAKQPLLPPSPFPYLLCSSEYLASYIFKFHLLHHHVRAGTYSVCFLVCLLCLIAIKKNLSNGWLKDKWKIWCLPLRKQWNQDSIYEATKNRKPPWIFFRENGFFFFFQINPTSSCDQNMSAWVESVFAMLDTFLLRQAIEQTS